MDIATVKKQRLVYLIVSTAVLLILGLLYAFSMFAAPMIADFGLEGVGSVFYVMIAFFTIGSLVGSFFQGKFGSRVTLMIAAACFATGFCVTGLVANSAGIVVLYLAYGVLGGLGTGVAYNTILSTVNAWFPDKVGLSSGIMLMGFGVAGLLCGNLALSVRASVGGMGTVLVAIGIIGGVLALVLSLVVKKAPADIATILCVEKKKNTGNDVVEDVLTSTMLKRPILYAFYFTIALMLTMGLAIIGNVASDGQVVGLSASFASLLVGLVSATNGVSRIIMGVVIDHIGPGKTFVLSVCLGVAYMTLIVLSFVLSSGVLFVAGALLCGFTYGCCPVVTSAFVAKQFGPSHYPSNLAVTNSNMLFGSLFNIIFATLFAASRFSVLIAVLICAVVALGGSFYFYHLYKKSRA